MGLINVPGSVISAEEETLLGYGRPAVIASTWKAYASLANNQTFIIPENSSGSPSLVTFEIEKSASGWTPTGGAVVAIDCTAAATLVALLAIVRDFLNARPNAAYTWAINGTNDGLVGTAKYVGAPWGIAPTGTAITAGSVSTRGVDPYDSVASTISEISASYDAGGSGVVGSDASSFDITGLACDTKGGFRITIDGRTVGSILSYGLLLVNGALVNLKYSGTYTTVGGNPASTGGNQAPVMLVCNAAGGAAGSKWTVIIDCPSPGSDVGPRTIFCRATYYSNPGGGVVQMTAYDAVYQGAGEIVSIGLVTSSDTAGASPIVQISGLTKYRLVRT